MKKILLSLLVIVILLVGGFCFLFYKSIDEDSYRKQILASTQELLGRQMQINGAVTVKVFPSPIITVSNIEIANAQGFENKNIITIDKIEAHVQFKSLFAKQLIVEHIVLDNPQIFLEKNATGAINWGFNFLKPSVAKVTNDAMLGMEVSDMPPQFQNTEIRNGTLSYSNAVLKKSFVLSGVNGKLKANAINGPYDFKGQFNLGKTPIDVDLNMEALASTVDSKFNLKLSAPNSNASFSTKEAQISHIAEPSQVISGIFSLAVPKLSAFLVDVNDYKNLPVEADKAIVGSGKFNMSAKAVSLDELALVYGDVNSDIAVSGKIDWTYPLNATDTMKTDAMLRFSQLNLDLFKPYMPKDIQFKPAVEKIISVLPVNSDFVVNSAFVTLNGGQLKELSIKGRLHDNIMDLADFSVILPSDAKLTSTGNVMADAQNPYLHLSFVVEGKDLGPAFEWSKIKTAFVQKAEALQNVKLSADLDINADNLTLKKISAQIGQSKITGDYALTFADRASFVQLQISSLNFDTLAPGAQYQQPQSLQQGLTDFQKYLASSALFTEHPVQFKLTGDNVTFKNLPIQKFIFTGASSKDEAVIDTLNLTQITTANIAYSGTIKRMDGVLFFDNNKLNLDVPKAQLLFQNLNIVSPIASSLGKITSHNTFRGTLNELELVTRTTLSQGRMDLKGVAKNLLSAEPTYEFTTKITFPGLTPFVRLFQPTYKTNPNLSGSFNFEGVVARNEKGFSFKDAVLSIGPQKLNFSLDFTKQEDDTLVQGKITSDQLFADKFITTTKKEKQTGEYDKGLLDFSSMDNLKLDVTMAAQKASWENFEVDNFETHILLSDKILKIEKTKANMGNGVITLESNLNFSAATPLLKGKLNINDVPVRPNIFRIGTFYLKNGQLTFTSDFDAKGNSIDDMVRSLSATGAFNVKNGTVTGMNLSAFERRSQAMIIRTNIAENTSLILNREFTAGETGFDVLEGTYAITNGLLRTTDTVLKAQTANALAQLDFNLPMWTLSFSSAVTFNNLAGYPPVAISVKGAARNPQVQIDLSSFVKYINDSAADTRNEQIRHQREMALKQQQEEMQQRIAQIAELTLNSQTLLERTEKTLKIAPSEEAQMHLIRAKDAFVLLQELSKKSDPSEADLAKASTQANQIKSRTQSALAVISAGAGQALRDKITQDVHAAQQIMQDVMRVYQRLSNVEIVYQAYQKSQASFDQMKQLQAFAAQAEDIMQLQQAVEQSAQALDTIDLAYQSIRKYDIDAEQPYYAEPRPVQTSSSIQGSIWRN